MDTTRHNSSFNRKETRGFLFKARIDHNLFFFQRATLYKEVLFTVTHKIGGNTAAVNPSPSRVGGGSAAMGVASRVGNIFGASAQAQAYNMLKDQLLEYAQRAFKVGQAEHRRIMEETVEEKVS